MTDKTDIELMQQALHAMLNFPNDISDEMFESIRSLKSALAEPEQEPLINAPKCTWTHDNDEGSWDAECGERWSITEGTPEENNFRFCPGCGRQVKIEAALAQPEPQPRRIALDSEALYLRAKQRAEKEAALSWPEGNKRKKLQEELTDRYFYEYTTERR